MTRARAIALGGALLVVAITFFVWPRRHEDTAAARERAGEPSVGRADRAATAIDDDERGPDGGSSAPSQSLTLILEVVDEAAHPIAGASVSALRVTGERALGVTDASGLLEFTHDGHTRLRVRALGYREETFVPPDQQGLREASLTVTLTGDGERRRLGVVSDARAPIPRALIVTLDADGTPLSSTRSDESGRFVVADGAREIVVAHRAHGARTVAVARTNDSASVEVTLPSSSHLEGHVRDGRGGPLVGARVRARIDGLRAALDPIARRARRATENAGRAIAAELAAEWAPFETKAGEPDGRFILGPLAPDAKIALSATSGTLTPASQEDISVAAGSTRAGLLLVLDEAAALSGVVTDLATGAPIAGATIAVRRHGGVDDDVFGRAISSSDGTYTAAIEPRARLTVQVSAGGYLSLEEGGLVASRGETVNKDFALKKRPKASGKNAREYTGIGTSIRAVDDGVAVLDVYDGPARGVLEPKDVIVRVDGEWVSGLPLAEVVERIKGEPGSDVELTVKRPGTDGVTELELVLSRQRIALPR